MLRIQRAFQSIAIDGLVKQIFLISLVMLLSCTVFLRAAQSASESPTINTPITVEQVLQRIAALEHGFEKESQAIAALDERIAQLELKYLDVKSGIEHSAAVHPGYSGSGSAGQVADAAATVSVQFPSVSVMTDSSGAAFEHSTAPYLALNTNELRAAGGFLAILLLLFALGLYRNRRQRGQSNTAIGTGFITVHDSVAQDQDNKPYRQSLLKLAALKKAAQGAEPSDESAIVIRQNQLSHKSVHSVIADAQAFMAQGQPELALQILESLLTKNRHSEIGWQLLFKILHDQNKKSAFRKHALRFKRLEQFPETWEKIQSWGHALEPDEPIYMNAQERKRRFFSN